MMTSEHEAVRHDVTIRHQWLQVLKAKNENLARAEARIADLETQLEEMRALLKTASQEV